MRLVVNSDEVTNDGHPTVSWYKSAIQRLGGTVSQTEALHEQFTFLGGVYILWNQVPDGIDPSDEVEIGRGSYGMVIAINDTIVEKRSLGRNKKMDDIIWAEYSIYQKLMNVDFIPKLEFPSFRMKPSRFRMERMASPLIGTQDEVLQIFHIIQEMHKRKYVIADIKRDNFMLDKNYNVKLIDLGLCELYIRYNGQHREDGYCKNSGTPMYMSVRSLESVTKLSRRDDLEAFLYLWEEIATGQLPWRRQGATIHSIIAEKKEFISESSRRNKFLKIVRNLRYGEDPPYEELYTIVSYSKIS